MISPNSLTVLCSEKCVCPLAHILIQGLQPAQHHDRFFYSINMTEVMPKVWVDLGQTHKAQNQSIWARVGIWRYEV